MAVVTLLRRLPSVGILVGLLVGILTGFGSVHGATVVDVTPTDVTTRALSVVWVSDEPVTTAALHVYADENGLTELTNGLNVTLASQAVAETHALGLVKADVSGLAADTCYYIQTETGTGTGVTLSPQTAPFIEVCTQIAAKRVTSADRSVVNDLILHNSFRPDGATPALGAIVLVSAPGLGAYPVSAIVGDGFAAPAGVADLNNLFEAATKTSAEIAVGDVLQITEMRGLLCSQIAEQRLSRFGRAPEHGEVSSVGFAITEIESADSCFFADTFCDDSIDILDAQRVLNAFGGSLGDCRFHPDLDIVADQSIDVLDLQSVLNRFGESAPFTP